MAKAVTLKNSNNEEVYPVTDISLVNGGIHADTIAPAEDMPKVDMSALCTVIGSGDNVVYRFGNTGGLQIAVVRQSFANTSTQAWGNIYQMQPVPDRVAYAAPFNTPPSVTYSITITGGGSVWLSGDWSNTTDPDSTTLTPKVVALSATSYTRTGTINYIAIGTWGS